MKPADERLRNLRGFTFLNTSLTDKAMRIKANALDKRNKAALKETVWEGKPAYHLHIDYNNPDYPVTAEDIWFDKETYFTLKNIQYEGEEKAADITWSDFEMNITLEDSLFEQ